MKLPSFLFGAFFCFCFLKITNCRVQRKMLLILISFKLSQVKIRSGPTLILPKTKSEKVFVMVQKLVFVYLCAWGIVRWICFSFYHCTERKWYLLWCWFERFVKCIIAIFLCKSAWHTKTSDRTQSIHTHCWNILINFLASFSVLLFFPSILFLSFSFLFLLWIWTFSSTK